jgi:alpha-1,3-glucosyltransferase
VFAISFGPFAWVGGMAQLRQIALRLFPFQRGLVHEYLAANFWTVWVSVKRLVRLKFKVLKTEWL